MRKNKLLFLMSMIMLTAFLAGCWSDNEPERMLYVHGLGVDYEEGEYKLYAQIINFKNVAKSEQPVSEKNQSEVGFASGKTIDEAIFKLYHTVDQKVFWGHMTYIVFSEEALNNGRMNPVLDSFLRYRETRYRVWLYSTDAPVKDVLLTIPIINTAITLSKLGDPTNSYKQESFVEPVNMRQMIIGLDEPSHEAIIPYITVVNNWETVEGKDPIAKLTGFGVLTPKEFKGFIVEDKARGAQWMKNETKRGEVTFSLNPDEEGSMTVILEDVKVKVKPIVKGDSVKFDVKVKIKGIVSVISTDPTYKEIKKKTEETVKKQIMTTYKEALDRNIDVYRLSETVYRKELKTWKRLQQDGKIQLTEDSIRSLDINVTIKSGRKQLTETIK